MRAILQRVSRAAVMIGDEIFSEIDRGLVVFLGVHRDDTKEDADFLVGKIVNMRLFADEDSSYAEASEDRHKMNRSLLDINGGILIVSQFTLYADISKGRRPSFLDAAPPEKARELYEYFVDQARMFNFEVGTGEFQAMMAVELVNDGPVTIVVDSKLSNEQ